jgi:membrane-bound serine protease (ClpP class)
MASLLQNLADFALRSMLSLRISPTGQGRVCRRQPLLLFLALLLLALASLARPAIAAAPAPAARPVVTVIHLDTTIQPVSAWYLKRGLHIAAQQHAAAVLVLMNTPGGLLDSMREMVHDILASPVPVIIYVAPAGSRAGSAGFFLLEAADVAAMAPGTNAGAAHPIIAGKTLDPILKQKLENDATAFLRSYVTLRKHNMAAAQDAVINSKSYSATEAMQLGLLTLISPNTSALLHSLDGQQITRIDGTTTTLHLHNADLVDALPSLRERILGKLMDPNLAVLLLLGGVMLIYFEFNAPGTIIPGALGTLLLFTGLFALNLLPLRYTAVMLLIAAVGLILLEIKVPSHGILATVGIICLVVGLLTLVAGPVPELRVRFATALGVGTGFGLITTYLVRIAMRARRNKVLTGPSAMLGAIGIAQEPFAVAGTSLARGQVLVRGELWFAETPQPVATGAHLKVMGVRGLTLLVEPVPAALS